MSQKLASKGILIGAISGKIMRQNEKVLAQVFKVFRREILFVLGARFGGVCPEALRYHYTVKKDAIGGVFFRGGRKMGDFSCMPAKHGSSGRENRHPSAAISSPRRSHFSPDWKNFWPFVARAIIIIL